MSSKDQIIALPAEQLRRRSARVSVITDEVLATIALMKDATLDWEDTRQHEVGVALAAVQVNRMMRIIIVRNDFDNKEDRSFTTLINPEITKREGQLEEDFEGCLSIRDIYGKVPRYPKVRVRALDEDGREFRVKAEGFLARVFQHEIDHMNGKVFIDHIKDKPEAFYKLTEDGKLEQLDYDKDVKDSPLLW